MKTTTMRTLMTAAALVVAATASAQTFKVEVPMAFQVAGKTMNAGSYQIQMKDTGAGAFVTVYDSASHTSVMVLAGITTDAPKAWRDAGDPRLAFAHHDGKYELRTLWAGSGDSAHQLPSSKSSNNVVARTELVTLAMVKVH